MDSKELVIVLVINGNAGDIRGQQVGGKLQALEIGFDGLRKRFGKRGLPRARIIFQQNMRPADQGNEEFADGPRLPPHHLFNIAGNFV